MQDSKYVIMLVKDGVAFWSKNEHGWVNLTCATVYNKEEVDAKSDRPMLGRFVELPAYNGNINVTINGYSVPSAKDVADAIVKTLRTQGVTR